MQYSTLQEAYNISTFKQPTVKKRTCSQSNNNQQLYSIENSSFASNKESIDYSNNNSNNTEGTNSSVKIGNANDSNNIGNFNNNQINKNSGTNGGTCAPLQAPMYTIPVSGNCKKERDEAIKTYTEENVRNNNVEKYNNYSNNVELSINNSSDNIRPFYDEDMEQYFDINNLKDEVNYKSNSDIKINDYMPNYNKKSYTNNNTNGYSNNNINSKNGINLLNNNEYNLSEEEKIKAREALDYLKSIEDKMNNNDVATLDPVKQPELTGPGGFTVKKTVEENTLKSQNTEINQKEELKIPTTIHDAKLIESINENKKTQNIFNMLINIFIFVFIGILIILLCDYIAELAIQIGSTKTANTLEPYIKYQMLYMQNMANNTSMMQNMQGGVNTIPGMTNIPGTIPLPTGMQVVQNIPYPILKN